MCTHKRKPKHDTQTRMCTHKQKPKHDTHALHTHTCVHNTLVYTNIRFWMHTCDRARASTLHTSVALASVAFFFFALMV